VPASNPALAATAFFVTTPGLAGLSSKPTCTNGFTVTCGIIAVGAETSAETSAEASAGTTGAGVISGTSIRKVGRVTGSGIAVGLVAGLGVGAAIGSWASCGRSSQMRGARTRETRTITGGLGRGGAASFVTVRGRAACSHTGPPNRSNNAITAQ